MEVENNSLARLEVRPCAQCKHEMSNLGAAQKGTDYLAENISESDLVCRVGRPPLLFNVLHYIAQGVFFYTVLQKSFPCVGVETTFMEVYSIKNRRDFRRPGKKPHCTQAAVWE